MNLYCQDNARYRQHIGASLNALIDESQAVQVDTTEIKEDIATINNTIASIENLAVGNIKSGVEILGYTGTYTNEDVTDAVTALDVAAGKVAYVNGVRIVGVAVITEYSLTVDETGTGNGTGSVTVDGDAYTIPVDFKTGAEIELVATADAGSVFVNWTISGVEVGIDTTYTHTMEATDVTIVANFDLEQP